VKGQGLRASPTVLQSIIRRAHIDPDHPAAKDLEKELSYAQLIDEVARFAGALRARGVNVGDRVALLIPNSVDFIIVALACQWTGAIFVPLAVTDPTPRLETVVADCLPLLVVNLVKSGSGGAAFLGNSPVVPIDTLRTESHAPEAEIDAADLAAYLIYTSGTTGTPKGVQISNAAFAAAVESTASALGLSPATKTLCVSPFHFDGSYANLFPTLVSGGTVVMRPRDALLYPQTFFKTVEAEGITYSGFTPSYLRLLLASRRMAQLNDSTLKMIALGGEATSTADLRALWSKAPAVRVFNRYGPTETTIAATNMELTPTMLENGAVPIGRPHPGVSFVLVDHEGRVIEDALRKGELYIGGVQLMDGYWAAPLVTSEVMRSDIVAGVNLYRTGDVAYRDQFENYVYVGRNDRVVKRSGVRISLDELSESMSKIEHVDSAACLLFDREDGPGIVAFVTTETKLSDVELRRAARQFIPENMLPDRIEIVDTMPLNRSNQLDEKTLLSMAGLEPVLRSGVAAN